jgi:hypothetical protein
MRRARRSVLLWIAAVSVLLVSATTIPASAGIPAGGATAGSASTRSAGAASGVDPIDLRVLVLSADGSEATLPAIEQQLATSALPTP